MPVIGEKPICLSGGAKGADLQWGMTAGYAGHTVFHFSFANHRSLAPSDEVVVLSHEQLVLADEYLLKANETLKRHFPPKNDFATNLLRRNWYQVRDSDAVYAVSTLKNGVVSGGTAWAVQMFIDQHNGEDCCVYLFDQGTGIWHTWKDAHWQPILVVPVPSGVWAGIGSRDLLDNGKNAIRTLMGWTPIMQHGSRVQDS